jgi:hypothetical protein
MADVYGTTTIPSDEITVRSGQTVAISVAFDTTLGLVGGMDTSNGSATPGEVQEVLSVPDAEDEFGADSELATQVELALAQDEPPSTIYAVGVSETTGETQTFTSTQSGTIDDAPVFDPNVQPEHEVTAQDTTEGVSADVNIVYATGADISTPSDANTINLNPITGEFEADESSDYDITYDYGDYTSAIDAIADKSPRTLGVLTESTPIVSDAKDDAESLATDFDFSHVIGGVYPETDASQYSDSFDSRRLSVVAAPRGFTDADNTNMARTIGAVAGKQAGKDLGDSTTYETLEGFADLNTKYTNSELGALIDEQVLPLKQGGGGIRIIKDMTTDTDTRFERIYASEIIDEATEISHRIAQNYIGTRNTDERRFSLRESHTSSYAEMADEDLLDDYHVTVRKGDTDFEVEIEIGIDVVGIMDTISVTITVGDVITNGGAS